MALCSSEAGTVAVMAGEEAAAVITMVGLADAIADGTNLKLYHRRAP